MVGDAPAYLSFDIDALDPAFAPGTGTPEIGGLASWQAQAILRRLRGVRFVGMDVVEVAPAYDVAEITALAAATMAWEYLALLGATSLSVCLRSLRTHNDLTTCTAISASRIAFGRRVTHRTCREPRRHQGAQQRRNASFSVEPVNRGPVVVREPPMLADTVCRDAKYLAASADRRPRRCRAAAAFLPLVSAAGRAGARPAVREDFHDERSALAARPSRRCMAASLRLPLRCPTVDELVAAERPEEPMHCLRPAAVTAATAALRRRLPRRRDVCGEVQPRAGACCARCGPAACRHFDCASLGEVRLVRQMFADAAIHFMHPVKARGAIREAWAQHGVRDFVLDTADELAKILRGDRGDRRGRRRSA